MNNRKLIGFINLMFFLVGMLVSVMSALIPEIIRSFNISYGLASLLPFSFYIALALTCVPTGIAGEKYPARNILIFAFLFALSGILVFVLLLSYRASVVSLFMTGMAVAMIQVTAVPLLRRACGPENLAFHSTLNQLMYGLGAFISPLLYSRLTVYLLDRNGGNHIPDGIVSHILPEGFEWAAVYWIFVILLILLIAFVLGIRFPAREDPNMAGQARGGVYREMFRNKFVVFYFFSLVAYASCEQGIAAWMSKFFQDYHLLNPLTEGASILSFYWLLLTLGCFGGMILLKIFESRVVLAGLTIFAIICLGFALYGGTPVSKVAFPLVAAFESVMWPVILSLALNSVAKHHEVLSGFMFTASVGGALGPVIVGSLGDVLGLRVSLHYIFLPLLIVLSVAFWARPLISNKTLRQKEH